MNLQDKLKELQEINNILTRTVSGEIRGIIDALEIAVSALGYYQSLKKEYLSAGGTFNPELMSLSGVPLQEIFNPAVRAIEQIKIKLGCV